ncbi:putative 4-phosphopantetheinyl transferase EntD [Escherichia coli p0305293.4]|nr:putative 4-phosphopantetheinyl transferase EntD [Escherichia coli p0305293.4]
MMSIRLLTTCALFMPDAACTPYPAYKIMLNQYIAELMWAG